MAQSHAADVAVQRDAQQRPALIKLYKQANATLSDSTRKQIEQEMQQFDFNQGGYIIPAFIDALDAYSDKVTGYWRRPVGQPLSQFNFEDWAFVVNPT